ncbi:MAG: GFA family protein [Notoacmeibacter sp.]
MSKKFFSGGCQCGAVRFKVSGELGEASICHCRMCQKASGAHALALVGVKDAGFNWTRGQPSWFASSNAAKRGFCAKCGTPLCYDAPDGLALSVVTFDEPDLIAPVVAYGVEGKRFWADGLADLPEHHTMDDLDDAPFLASLINFQHPDHDTETWPPEEKQ